MSIMSILGASFAATTAMHKLFFKAVAYAAFQN